MFILRVNTKCLGGGAANTANRLHTYVNKNTKHLSFFLYGRGDHGGDNCLRIKSRLGVYLSAFIERYFGFPFNAAFDARIEKYVRKADVIHMHNMHGYYLDYVNFIMLVKKYCKPMVWTFHDMWPITGRCAFSEDCGKWKIGCGSCNHKKFYPKTMRDLSKMFWEKKWIYLGASIMKILYW